LTGAHAPAYNGTSMFNAQLFGHKLVLGSHVIKERNGSWESLISEFEGEVDWPLPKRAVMIMKYFFGFKTWYSPTSHSLSAIDSENQLGYMIAGSFDSPNVFYAIQARGIDSPD
jgi:hypothetical protein